MRMVALSTTGNLACSDNVFAKCGRTFQLLPVRETDAVDALQRRLARVAAPERSAGVRDGHGFDESRVRHVRPSAEVHHAAAAVQADDGALLHVISDDVKLHGKLLMKGQSKVKVVCSTNAAHAHA